jgi:hypothetical protein|tara:strand:- start:3833 stop:4006 length:174 start_codon:yes stop_codon:yes gene_type:complete
MSEKEKLMKIIEDLEKENYPTIQFTKEEYGELVKDMNALGAKVGVYVEPPIRSKKQK